MEFSTVFRAANGSVPSPNGSLIASIVPPKLVVRSASTLQVQRVVNLNPKFASKICFLRWSPLPQNDGYGSPLWNGFPLMGKRRSGIDNAEEEGTAMQRVLLADEETIQVFDVRDEKWTATISQGFGGIKNVEFGRNEDEVIVFSEFQMKVTVWNLVTSKHVEIPHPKFCNKGYGYRPCTSHFALLTRSTTHDIISVHQNTSYRIVANFTLPTTDAQGLKWSPCGRWIAVWDSATSGYKVLVYTADGHLYRTYEKPCDGLGVKGVEWSPGGDFLTIGGYDGRLCFLNNYTFSPVIEMNHTRTVRLPGVTVWSECSSSAIERYYAQVPQPTSLPTVQFNPSDPQPKVGISTIAFNPDGTLIATRNDIMPSTVWIWSLKLLRPYAVLVQLNPIKSISWHPSINDLLMIQCTAENSGEPGMIYLWSSSWQQPRAVQIPMEQITGSSWAKWVLTNAPSPNTSSTASASPPPFSTGRLDRRSNTPEKESDKRPMLLFGDKEGFLVGYVEDEPVPEARESLEMQTEEDGYQYPLPARPSWDPVDWNSYTPSQQLPVSPLNNPTSRSSTPFGSQARGGLGGVTEPIADPAGAQSPIDDTFEYKSRGQDVSVQN